MNSIMPDLRYALRQLRKTPTYAQVDDKTMKWTVLEGKTITFVKQ